MLGKYLILTAFCCLVGAQARTANRDYSFLQQFHGNFSELSSQMEHELQGKRDFNGQLIREFNREILLEFGRMVPRMRTAHHDFAQYVMNFEGASEECRDYVMYLLEWSMILQEWDIQDCAYLTHLLLRDDALLRFLPSEHEISRENLRATVQVVQTLSRNGIFEVEAIRSELQDEQDYFTNVQEFYRELLNEELAQHGEDAHITINWLEYCIDYSFEWQDDDHEYLREYLEDDCEF